MEEYLIVDGYNIIGAWPELRDLKLQGRLEEARDELLQWLIEYQAYSGKKVIAVFDAHQVPGVGKKYINSKLTIYYTKENETADDLIEKLVRLNSNRRTRIYVATSDYAEQSVIFGQGALRISARELAIEKVDTKNAIKTNIDKEKKEMKSSIVSSLDDEMIKFFENWRRKK